MSACESNSTSGLLFATDVWCMSYHNSYGTQHLQMTVSQHTGLTVPFPWPSLSSVCSALSGDIVLSIKGWLISVIYFGLSSANKISSVLLSVFTSSMATLASKLCCFLGSSCLLWAWLSSVAHIIVGTVPLTLTHILHGNTSLTQFFFQKYHMCWWSSAAWQVYYDQQRQLHDGCQCSLVNILSEEGNYCVKILLVLIWVCSDCGDCCGQLVTPNTI